MTSTLWVSGDWRERTAEFLHAYTAMPRGGMFVIRGGYISDEPGVTPALIVELGDDGDQHVFTCEEARVLARAAKNSQCPVDIEQMVDRLVHAADVWEAEFEMTSLGKGQLQ